MVMTTIKNSVLITVLLCLLSCGSKKNEVKAEPAPPDKRILISTTATDSTTTQFFLVDEPDIVQYYFELFVDSSEFSPYCDDYDHRIQCFEGDSLVEEVYVNGSSNMYTYCGTKNIQSGHVINKHWNALLPHRTELQYNCFILPSKRLAQEFYAFAQAKGIFIFAPSYCDWLNYDVELYIDATRNGDPITIDSLELIIQRTYPNEIFELECLDFVFEFSTPMPHKQFKLTCSEEFARKFSFRDRTYSEVQNQTYRLNGHSFLFNPHRIPTGLRSKDSNPLLVESKVKPFPLSAARKERFEGFMKFAPIIEVVGTQAQLEACEAWFLANGLEK